MQMSTDRTIEIAVEDLYHLMRGVFILNKLLDADAVDRELFDKLNHEDVTLVDLIGEMK